MADISMCVDEKCPMRKSCYRFMAKPNELLQSYLMSIRKEKEPKCKHFLKIDEK